MSEWGTHMKKWLATIAIAFLTMGAVASAETRTPVTTVFLVRHAEKNPHPAGGDAGLSAKGQLRAAELARVLGPVPLDAVYSTSFGRARMTAEAVARAQKDTVRTYDPDHPERLAERIRATETGDNVLVVGHSDTIPGTYEALTGEVFPDSTNVPYDKLYIVVLDGAGGHRLLTLRYGAPAE